MMMIRKMMMTMIHLLIHIFFDGDDDDDDELFLHFIFSIHSMMIQKIDPHRFRHRIHRFVCSAENDDTQSNLT
jgi:hypothetical protein